MPERLPPLSCISFLMLCYFLNLLRPVTARPIKPDPSITSVMGSERGKAVSPFEASTTALDFATTFDVATLGTWSSVEGQPTKPKHTITTHKEINNFFNLLST